MSSILTRSRLARADEIADRHLGRFDGQRRADDRMGDQAIDRAFEIAPVGDDRARDERDHRRRDLEVRILGARRGDARLEDLHAQRLVERRHLDAKAAGETRAHALVERFEIGRRAVGGDHDLAAGIEQRVERVAELGLDRLALQELHVVE